MGYSPGYGVGVGWYGARPDGVVMKREEMRLSFSVCKEEAEAEEEMGGANGGRSSERRTNGMDMEVDVNMD